MRPGHLAGAINLFPFKIMTNNEAHEETGNGNFEGILYLLGKLPGRRYENNGLFAGG
jgi:hypothetical protein